jgi:hypothetical protein
MTALRRPIAAAPGKHRRQALRAALLIVALHGIGPPARAQELQPRAYGNLPVGSDVVAVTYAYSRGGVATDPSVPLEDADLTIHGAALGYLHAFDLWERCAKLDVIVPYGWLDGSASLAGERKRRVVDGFGDPLVRLSWSLYGAPALTLDDFASWEQDLVIGTALELGLPLGQYDADRAVNLGTNRWSIKPEVGASKAFGPVTIEVASALELYTDNDGYVGGATREQDPIVSVQGHVTYRLGVGIWAAVSGTYYAGGRTTVSGVEGDDLQENARVGANVAIPLSRVASANLYASTGVATRTGSDFDLVGIALQYRWGTAPVLATAPP